MEIPEKLNQVSIKKFQLNSSLFSITTVTPFSSSNPHIISSDSSRHCALALDIPIPDLTSTSKSPSAPHTLLQLANLHHLRRINSLQHQLRNAISFLNLEILLSMIKQQDLDLATIVCIYDPSASIDHVFGCQPGTGRYASIYHSPHPLAYLSCSIGNWVREIW